MRRLYFLAPDVDSTRRIVDDLLLHHVEERHIHVVASDEKAVTGTPECRAAIAPAPGHRVPPDNLQPGFTVACGIS